MTFSVDSDFWPFQSDPRRDGPTRTEASEGRGKAFASSLFGVSDSPEATGGDTRSGSDALTLGSLNFDLARASIGPSGDDDELEQVAARLEAQLPNTDPTQKPALTTAPEFADIKSGPPAGAQPANGGTTLVLLQGALPDNSMSTQAPPLAGLDLSEDVFPGASTPANPPPLALPSAELIPNAIVGEAFTEAPDAKSDALPERKPQAPEATVVLADNSPNTAALSQATLVPSSAAPLPALGEVASPRGAELVAAPPPAQPQPSPLASDVAGPAEARPRAVQVTAEAMMATPAATAAATSSTRSIQPAVPVAATPAADTPQSRPLTTEPEIQPSAVEGAFVDAIDAAALPTGISDSTAQPQGAAAGDSTSGPPIGPLSAGGLLQGQPAGQIAVLPASTPLTPTHAVLIAAPSHLPDIIARATRDGGQDERITVQLDPPELGRISIDFKFDGQGLQHVTITAENPEAMRQLRQMHFELVQALERNGLSGQDMSFQHQNPQQNEGWGQQPKIGGSRADTPALTGSNLIIAADNTPNRQSASSGRLDIRL